MTSRISIKAGDTFVDDMTWSAGSPLTPVDLTGYTVTSKVRKRDGELVATLTCTPDSDQTANRGVFEVDFGDTSEWPAAASPLHCDIRFTSGSDVTTTETFEIHVSLAESR